MANDLKESFLKKGGVNPPPPPGAKSPPPPPPQGRRGTIETNKWKQLSMQLFLSMEGIADSCHDCEALADCGGCVQIRVAREAVKKAKKYIIDEDLNSYCPICKSREIKEDPNVVDPEPFI